jgi:hypothetical protein
MWVYVAASHAAFNLDQVTRLYVEETGTGAALKAEISGKPVMVGYFGSRAEAQAALDTVLEKQEAGSALVRL